MTLCAPMDCSMPGFPVHHQLPELSQTHVHRVGDDIQPSHPLSSPSLSMFPSIRAFSKELVLHIRWPKYWSFSFSISPSNEYSGMISFRIDWFDLFAVQGTLKSFLPAVLIRFSHVQLFATPWTAARQVSLSFMIAWSLLKFMFIQSVMPSNHLILYHLLLLPSIFPSIRVFSNESVLHIRWLKYWSFCFCISPSNE